MTDYEKIILEIKNENKRLQLLINDLIKSNDELKQKLAYYENPHSPPSSNSLLYRKQKAEKRQKNNGKSNRGGVPCHKGATQKFIPQKVQHHELSGFIVPIFVPVIKQSVKGHEDSLGKPK